MLINIIMMTSSNGNIFRVTGHLCGEFTGPRWIPHTKASDAELWYFLSEYFWINGWENTREADDLRRYRAHYDVTVKIGNALLPLVSLCPNCLHSSCSHTEQIRRKRTQHQLPRNKWWPYDQNGKWPNTRFGWNTCGLTIIYRWVSAPKT